MKKVFLLAVAMVMFVSARAQHSVGTFSVVPKVGFNLANLAGDVSHNSMKFALAAGGDVVYQLSDLIALSGGAMVSMQ